MPSPCLLSQHRLRFVSEAKTIDGPHHAAMPLYTYVCVRCHWTIVNFSPPPQMPVSNFDLYMAIAHHPRFEEVKDKYALDCNNKPGSYVWTNEPVLVGNILRRAWTELYNPSL